MPTCPAFVVESVWGEVPMTKEEAMGSGPQRRARGEPNLRKASTPEIIGPVLPEEAKLSLTQMPDSASNPDNGANETGILTKGLENYNNDFCIKSLDISKFFQLLTR